jgi:hypothetical protein
MFEVLLKSSGGILELGVSSDNGRIDDAVLDGRLSKTQVK